MKAVQIWTGEFLMIQWCIWVWSALIAKCKLSCNDWRSKGVTNLLRALHDSDYCGGIINTDIINKGKLPDTSCPLLVEKEENKCKQVPVVSHCPSP